MELREVLAGIDSQRRSRPNLETPLVPPADLVEEALSELWAEVLGVSQIGTLDSFFALGGDSLHMTQVASRLRAQFGIEVSFTQFFEGPTVAALATLIRENAGIPKSEFVAQPQIQVLTEANIHHLDKEYGVPQLALDFPRLTIEALVVPTRNRPAALLRCLRGFMKNLRHYGHSCRVVIAEDSSGNVDSAEAEGACAALGRDFGIQTRYLGSRERARLKSELVKVGLDRDVVAFAIDGWPGFEISTSGATRNFLALLVGDGAYVSVDDDTECLFATADNLSPGQLMTEVYPERNEPSDLRAFSSRAQFVDSVSLRNLDFIDAHQQLLGRVYGNSADYQSAVDSTSGRVLITLPGVAGDCGWGSPSRFFLYDDDLSLKHLAGSRSDWAATLTSRETLRVSRCYAIGRRAELMMTTAFGADNRALLPPFVPVGRGSDMLFGSMLTAIQPGARFGYLPWAVVHSPVEARQFWSGEYARSAGTSDIATMLRAVGPTAVSGMSGASALIASGQGLIDLAHHSRSEFVSIIRERIGEVMTSSLTALEEKADALYGTIPHWADDAREYVRHARERLNGRYSGIPAEFLYGREFDHAAELTRKLVGQFGKLLVAWPDIRVSAQQLS